jgi:uncharacterized protein (DUF983 family)
MFPTLIQSFRTRAASRVAAILATFLIGVIGARIELSAELAAQLQAWSELTVTVLFMTGYALLHPVFEAIQRKVGRKTTDGES